MAGCLLKPNQLKEIEDGKAKWIPSTQRSERQNVHSSAVWSAGRKRWDANKITERWGARGPWESIKVLSVHYKRGLAEKMMPALRFINNQSQAFLSRGLLWRGTCTDQIRADRGGKEKKERERESKKWELLWYEASSFQYCKGVWLSHCRLSLSALYFYS